MVLGQMRAVHGAYREGDLSVEGTGDTAAALRQALQRLTREAAGRGLDLDAGPRARPGPAPLPAASAADRPDGYLRARPAGRSPSSPTALEVPFEVPASQAAELRQLLGPAGYRARPAGRGGRHARTTPRMDRPAAQAQ